MASQSYYQDGMQQQNYGPPQGQYNQGYNNGYQPQQGPQYTQGPPQYDQNKPPGPTQQQYGADGKQSFDQAFKLDKPKYNDLWAGILFILTILGFAAVSGLSIHGYATTSHSGIYNNSRTASTTITLNSNTLILFAFVLGVAFVLSWLYLLAARAFTKQFIWITGILNILIGIGTAIYYLYRHYWSAGIVFAIFAVFSIFCFITWIPRIPFSVLMLQTTIDVARKHGHVFLVSLIGGLVGVAFSAWFSVTLVSIYVQYHPGGGGCSTTGGGSCSNAKVIGLIAFITFAAYWISEFIKNAIHATTAGVYGSWFFLAGSPSGMPSNATRQAFRRTMTYSFGSISFGSLVVALINCLRQIVSIAQSQAASDGNIGGQIAFCILGCIISLLQWLVEFINKYAFCHIALYGKPYIAAAKDTWRMMKNRGIDALVNDLLIGPVLSMGAVFVGFVCALLSYLYLEFTNPAYNEGRSYTGVVLAFSFLIGLQVCSVFMTPLASGVDTFFVAAAWDPEVLMRDHRDIYEQMIRVYPKVQEAIHA